MYLKKDKQTSGNHINTLRAFAEAERSGCLSECYFILKADAKKMNLLSRSFISPSQSIIVGPLMSTLVSNLKNKLGNFRGINKFKN